MSLYILKTVVDKPMEENDFELVRHTTISVPESP